MTPTLVNAGFKPQSLAGNCLCSFAKTAACAVAKWLQSCLTLRPHRWQPTRLPHPWDSPGKNTEVGCHFLLQCMNVKSESEVAQSCPTLSNLMDCGPPGSSIHGIFQARVLEWGTIALKLLPNLHDIAGRRATKEPDQPLHAWLVMPLTPLIPS